MTTTNPRPPSDFSEPAADEPLASTLADAAAAEAAAAQADAAADDVAEASTLSLDPILATPTMAGIRDLARRIAATPGVPLLITGDPGTGAEELARHVHDIERGRPTGWIAVRCRGISEERLYALMVAAADELRAAAADGAGGPRTLFIDEIAHLGPTAQEQLVELLQRIRRDIGRADDDGDEPGLPRVVAATASDLRRAVRDRTFRSDLLDLLAVVEVRLPPLRERGRDIVPLAEAYLRATTQALARPAAALAPAARAKLTHHAWPGNCRELRAVIERAVVLEPEATIGPQAIVFADERPTRDRPVSLAEAFATASSERGRPLALREIEQLYIVWLLEHTRGNRTAASRILGISYPTMQKKILDYGIDFREIAARRMRSGGD
jgi:DNA-binding NtrC family response regulator